METLSLNSNKTLSCLLSFEDRLARDATSLSDQKETNRQRQMEETGLVVLEFKAAS